jgi:serine/threonine-protein kinase
VDPKLEPGSLVADRYRLERVLGEGGMGVVWSATHEVTHKRVALKLVKRAADTVLRARMLREARASCAVRHAHVREIYDVVETDEGLPVMVMEYLIGESLAGKLARERKLALPEAAALVLPVVSAVGAAHAVGIVHRDLKPENIFLAGAGPVSVKVLDFGIAKLMASEGAAAATAALTSSGALLGTPYYMSPEQAFGEKDIDHRTDVWALGLILYQCLSGVLPTQADNVGQVFKIIVARPIPPLEQIAPELPPEVTSLVGRMLSRSRKDRPGDLHEVAEVLARYTDVEVPDFGAPASAPSAGDGDAPDTEAAGPVDPLAETDAAPASRDGGAKAALAPVAAGPADARTLGGTAHPTARRSSRRGAAAALGMAILAAGAWLAWGRGAPPPAAASASSARLPPAPPESAAAPRDTAPAAGESSPPAGTSPSPSAEPARAPSPSARPAASARAVAERSKAAATPAPSAPPASPPPNERPAAVPLQKDW